MALGPGGAKKIAICWAVIMTVGIGSFFVAKQDVDNSRGRLLEQTRKIEQMTRMERDQEKKKT